MRNHFYSRIRLSALGMWLEQLIAENTGKEGKGILPITGEALPDPTFYRDDRLFVQLHVKDESQPEVTQKLYRLTAAGHPLVRISIEGKLDIAGEFYRWQMAVAMASGVIGINAFERDSLPFSLIATSLKMSRGCGIYF